LAQRGCEAAGIQAFSLHDLRWAYASHLLEAGFSLAQISSLLGHADLITTQRYLRLVGPQVDRSKLPW
jgi:integrase/recombinase XerD